MKNVLVLFFILSFAYSKAQDSTLIIPEIPTGVDNNTYFVIADTNYTLYRLPESFTKPQAWVKQDERRANSYVGYFNKHYPDSMNLEIALSLIDSAQQFNQVREAICWCIYNYEEAFQYLVPRLSYKTKIGLKNTADLIIGGRIHTGDLRFYGHGGMIREDLFTVAGRASAALIEITGEEFALVHPDLTKEETFRFKQLWLEYLGKL